MKLATQGNVDFPDFPDFPDTGSRGDLPFEIVAGDNETVAPFLSDDAPDFFRLDERCADVALRALASGFVLTLPVGPHDPADAAVLFKACLDEPVRVKYDAERKRLVVWHYAAEIGV